ncbi:uncharacterized protein DUF4435 [Anaerospora hongkongensis]|uniref:Uncharacterized protein DUF4435 n=1 Tax=Anaerospora hongkongensis TaxID=244830 RepID=A0A4R1Q7G1_9FIRM|nr:DUF4435 domain-containing protein [Anaerospora hongkongensis]TCL38079.1 uncharacterized protein DUF4435 [Anaerospora hongkongensis]
MNASEDELVYSSEASATRYLYYQELNDINIFVEDAGKEYEYETIFKRLLGDQYSISTIFALGGKSNVRRRYEEFGSETPGNSLIKNFYIVDGDFDRYINPDELINDPCFIYLETYNIENYFLDENACTQFAKGRLRCFDSVVKNKINFCFWKDTIVEQASKLFLCYCFVKKYFPSNESVKRSAYLFIDYKTGFERSDGAYQQYWEFILELDSDAEKKISEIANNYEQINGNNYYNLICGKFLIDSLYSYIRSIITSKFDKDDFKWHLINHFDISQLNYIKSIITRISA